MAIAPNSFREQIWKDALTNCAWHLWGKHESRFSGWASAKITSKEGITEKLFVNQVLYDDTGEERQYNPCPNKKAKYIAPQDKCQTHRRDPRSRSRSRSDNQLAPICSQAPAPPARRHEVTISRIELDEMIDYMDRVITERKNCSHLFRQWASQAGETFDNETQALETCKATMERFRRA